MPDLWCFMWCITYQRIESNGILARNVEFSQIIVDYQRKLRESSDSSHAAEELSRKMTMEVKISSTSLLRFIPLDNTHIVSCNSIGICFKARKGNVNKCWEESLRWSSKFVREGASSTGWGYGNLNFYTKV